MPKTTLTFPSLETIPAGLQNSVTKVSDTQYTVEVFYGGQDVVASELNPALETTKNTILEEKRVLQTKYDGLLQSTATLAREKSELEVSLSTGLKVTPEEKQILDQVKTLGKIEDVKSAVTDYTAIKTERDTLIAEKTNSAIFKASGLKNEKIFLDLISNPSKMDGVVKTFVETVDGKEVVYVTVKDAVGVESKKTFDDYYKNNAEWKPYIPALTQGQDNATWFAQQSTNGDNGGVQTQGNVKTNPLLAGVIESINKTATAGVETK